VPVPLSIENSLILIAVQSLNPVFALLTTCGQAENKLDRRAPRRQDWPRLRRSGDTITQQSESL